MNKLLLKINFLVGQMIFLDALSPHKKHLPLLIDKTKENK